MPIIKDTDQKRSCFVITPIGADYSEIRQHIDSVIDGAILPAIYEDYESFIPHRLYQSTTITKQIYRNLYDCDLVIANLTGLNPNVMYELAVRFCIGKPVIIIAESGTKLPFDVKDHRTLFYVNNYNGTMELRDNIKKVLETIDYDAEPTSPIHDALNEISVFSKLNSSSTNDKNAYMLSLIMKKLDRLIEYDSHVETNNFENSQSIKREFANRYDHLLEDLYEIKQGTPMPWLLDEFNKKYNDFVSDFNKNKKYFDELLISNVEEKLSNIYCQYQNIKRYSDAFEQNFDNND